MKEDKTNKYNNEQCSDKMTFEDCELAILRHAVDKNEKNCLLYTSPSPRDRQKSRMPSSA